MRQIPRENVIAAFPTAIEVGNVTLKPLTLGGAIRLSAIGFETSARVTKENLFAVAATLAGEDDLKRFLKHVNCGMAELAGAIEKIIDEAHSTFLKPDVKDTTTINLTPHGLGWPLEFAEWLCSEYGWSLADALDTPVATAFALNAAARQRNGGRFASMDYLQRQYSADVKAGKVNAPTIG